MTGDPLIESLTAALADRPDDVPLQLHLAGLLLAAGRPAEALARISAVLAVHPTDGPALALLQQATSALVGPPAAAASPPLAEPPVSEEPPAVEEPGQRQAVDGPFDWSAAESDLGDLDHPFARPAFVDDTGAERVAVGGDDPLAGYEIERPALRLSDVGGMESVKERLEVAFLTPMRNPELRQAFSRSLRGGLMLYGPPGCGKTYVARALAGELGARFASVSLADVLDMWVGSSERNIAQLFAAARQAAPCVLFLDEIDALGHKRSQMRGSAQRGSVNQLLTELDGVGAENDGVFVLAASNAPWDVDPALRRPGRFDRTLLVLPPEPDARAAILRHHLALRPVSEIDIGKLVKQTDRFSGADLAHLVETAADRALTASARAGEVRPITMKDLSAARSEVRPSTGPWFDTARNVAEFANQHGEYDELMAYLKRQRLV